MTHDYDGAIKVMEVLSVKNVDGDRYESYAGVPVTTIIHALKLAKRLQEEPSPNVLLAMMKLLDGKKLHDTYHDMIAQLMEEVDDDQ